jgi:hypothetical protein
MERIEMKEKSGTEIGDRPTEATRMAIRQVALEYIEAWYEADPVKMERVIHPELAKRIVLLDPIRGFDRLEPISALGLIIATRRGVGAMASEAERQVDITILDVYESAASVKIETANAVEYLHIAHCNQAWVVVNVLWERKPERKLIFGPQPM